MELSCGKLRFLAFRGAPFGIYWRKCLLYWPRGLHFLFIMIMRLCVCVWMWGTTSQSVAIRTYYDHTLILYRVLFLLKTLRLLYRILIAITSILKSFVIIVSNVIRDFTSAVGYLLGHLVHCCRLLRFTRSKTYSMDLMTGRGELIRETLTSLTPIAGTLL
jgi:hypothetical protein